MITLGRKVNIKLNDRIVRAIITPPQDRKLPGVAGKAQITTDFNGTAHIDARGNCLYRPVSYCRIFHVSILVKPPKGTVCDICGSSTNVITTVRDGKTSFTCSSCDPIFH